MRRSRWRHLSCFPWTWCGLGCGGGGCRPGRSSRTGGEGSPRPGENKWIGPRGPVPRSPIAPVSPHAAGLSQAWHTVGVSVAPGRAFQGRERSRAPRRGPPAPLSRSVPPAFFKRVSLPRACSGEISLQVPRAHGRWDLGAVPAFGARPPLASQPPKNPRRPCSSRKASVSLQDLTRAWRTSGLNEPNPHPPRIVLTHPPILCSC